MKIKRFFSDLLTGYNLSILVICLLIIVTPSLNDPSLFNSTFTSKLIYFLYGTIVLFGVYCFNIICSSDKLFSLSKIDIILSILLVYITVNRYFIQSVYGFSISYIELLGLSFFYIILKTISIRHYSWILLSIVFSGIIQAIYGYLQLFGFYNSNHSGFKMTGSFFNPGPYAGFLVSVWIIAFGMYLFRNNLIKETEMIKKSNSLVFNSVTKYSYEYIPLLGVVCILIILPALQSRASWLAAIIGGAVLLELKYHFLKNIFIKVNGIKQKKTLLVFFVGIFVVGLSSLYHYKKDSSDGRVFIWKITTGIIAEAPVFGVGFDQFTSQYMNYQANYFAKNGETAEEQIADNTNYAFNDWLQFMAENGILGFLLLLIVFFLLFQTKTKKSYAVTVFVVKTGILTIGVFACFSYPMQILPIKMLMVILFVFVSNSTVQQFEFIIAFPKCTDRRQIGRVLIFNVFYRLVIFSLGIIIVFETLTYIKKLDQSFVIWNKALSDYQYRDYNGAIREFELAYPILEKDGNFLMNYGKTLFMAGISYKAIVILEKAKQCKNNVIVSTALGDSYKMLGQYEKAEEAYKKAINMVPGKFYPNYLLTKLYDTSGQEFKTIVMAKKLINKKVKVPSTAVDEIKKEMRDILLKYRKPLE